MCLQVTGKPRVLRSNKLLTFNLMPCLLDVESFLISSDLIALQLLLELLPASRCHRSLCLPISSQLISCRLSFFHLTSALRSSRLLSHFLGSSQLITTVLFSSHVISACLISFHLSFSQLLSDFLLSASLRFSQLFSTLLSSAAHVSSSYVFSSPLPSSHIF